MSTGARRWWRELRRAVAWHRRLLAAGLAAAAVALTISAVRPAPPVTEAVLAAARDLPGGLALGHADLRRVELPPDAVPAGALRPGAAVAGQVLAGPMRSGEPLTDARLVGPTLLAGLAEGRGRFVAAPVRIADPAVVALLRPGDRVDVLAAESSALTGYAPPPDLEDPSAGTPGAPEGGGQLAPPGSQPEVAEPVQPSAGARVVASGVRVITVPRTGEEGSPSLSLAEGALVVLATTPQVASDLAAAAVTSQLSVTLLPP